MSFLPASDVLSDITVLDLTRVRSGPTAVRQLADWGANVLKIEAPSKDAGGKGGFGGPRGGPDFQNLHRNKRSMTLDLKSAAGKELFHRLAREADVIVENYRPGVKHRLGIDYESLKPHNPGLVYASISGFGQEGPHSGRPGFDQIAQGMGGLMSITGQPGQGPMRVGIPIADLCAGILCAQGVLLALHKRHRDGKGQWVHTSLLQAQVFMLDFQAARWLMNAEVPGQAGNNHPTSIPTGVFETSDGHINIACAGESMWVRLADELNDERMRVDLFSDAESRSRNRDELNELINEHTRTATSMQWIERLNEAGVPCGEINTIDQVFASPQVEALRMARDMNSQERGDTQVVGQPITMSDSASEISRPPPLVGQHTDELLQEFGLSTADISELREQGAFG